MAGQNTPSQSTQTQNTPAQNTQSQNTRDQSTHWPKIPKILSHTNWIINTVLNCKFSEASNYLSLLMFEKVCSAEKNSTSQSFHRNWSWTEKQPRKSKRWVHTRDTPQVFWHCESNIWFNSHGFRHCGTKLWSPFYQNDFQIFRHVGKF